MHCLSIRFIDTKFICQQMKPLPHRTVSLWMLLHNANFVILCHALLGAALHLNSLGASFILSRFYFAWTICPATSSLIHASTLSKQYKTSYWHTDTSNHTTNIGILFAKAGNLFSRIPVSSSIKHSNTWSTALTNFCSWDCNFSYKHFSEGKSTHMA